MMQKCHNTFSLLISCLLIVLILSSCKPEPADETQVMETQSEQAKGKAVIYQVLPRLFGNEVRSNKAWGSKEENGVGKFEDFTDTALLAIKEFGVSHIWYTGVPHHALIGDYTKFGIANDDPDVVKGRAGSPYAIKDYYNVNPDLAINPANRLAEFKSLVDRTHKHGMKVIIDIVPNHIARKYDSISMPAGIENFGKNDDTAVEYKRDNNFYYVVGKAFKVPDPLDGYQPLGGEKHPLSDGKFDEFPAKWTGNGSRKAQPHFHDWYETVKVNYGVRPDGSYDFIRLPDDYRDKDLQQHYKFWQNKDVPDSWKKFRDIVLYWIDFGVDGFRYDMAEMVPVEFWSYLNSAIKHQNPDAFLLAEVYNRELYRDYIQLGKMDYLYDKVDFYDTLKLIMQGKQASSALIPVIENIADIDPHMLHFLENHDEQRIASPDFAGDARMGQPAMVVSALVSQSPTMLYFAQALGEAAADDAGFGRASRTSIFDYWAIDSLQRWRNGGTFDGGGLTAWQKVLRDFYVRLLSFSATSDVLLGEYSELHLFNLQQSSLQQSSRRQATHYNEQIFSFARWNQNNKLVVISNFSNKDTYTLDFKIPSSLIKKWALNNGNYELYDVLSDTSGQLQVIEGEGVIKLVLEPFASKVLLLR